MKIVKFIMLCGIPAAGKSTYAKQLNRLSHNSYMILSSDKIREELLGSAEDQSNNALIFKISISSPFRKFVLSLSIDCIIP